MHSVQNTVHKGLFQDSDYLSQPEGTYPYALNAVNVSLVGYQNYLSSEVGSRLRTSVPAGYYPIGAVNMLEDQILVFSVLPTDSGSEIGIFDPRDNSYTTVLNDTLCFAFNINKQIQGVFKLRKGCNRTVYWTDDHNSIKVIDVDDVIANPTNYQDSGGNWNCDLFTLSLPRSLYSINNIYTQDLGGALRVGTYQVVFRYLDEDFNPTPWLDLSNTIPVIDEPYNSPYHELDGFTATPTNSTSLNTTKSIKVEVGGIDTDFRYIQMAAIEYTSSVPNTPRVVIKPEVSISSSAMTFIYSGFDSNSDELTELSEIIFPPVTWERCKTIAQLDNQLLLGNVKSKAVEFALFQQAANTIQVNYITKALYENQGTKYPEYYDDYRSLMRDEVYSLGIVWIFNDGYETPVFHIPGRAKDFRADGSAMPPSDTDLANGYHSRDGFTGLWDSATTTATGTPFSDFDNRITKQVRSIVAPERWQVYNTAHRSIDTDTARSYLTKGELAYWESTVAYPDDLACDKTRVYPSGNIRHHKMPDTTLEPHFFGQSTDTSQNPFADNTSRIVTLGLSFANIVPPAGYSSLLQGYKIVIGDREGNRSVIDKGIFYKNNLIEDAVVEPVFDIFDDQVDISSDYYQQTFPYNKQRGLDIHTIIPDITRSNYPFITPIVEEPDNGVTESGYIYPDESSPTSFSFHSPLTKFKKASAAIDHIKIERELAGDVITWKRVDLDGGSDSDDWNTHCPYQRSYVPSFSAFDRLTNRIVTAKAYCDPDSFIPSGVLSLPFLNATQQETMVLETDIYLREPQNEVDTSYQPSDGDARVSTCYYGAIKIYDIQQYGNIDTIKYRQGSRTIIPTSTTSTDIYPGDIFIVRFNFRKTYESWAQDTGPGAPTVLKDGHMPEFWCETDINTDLRNEGDTSIALSSENCDDGSCERYFSKSFSTGDETLGTFLDAKYCHINYYALNDNFNQLNIARVYFPIEQGFNYCSNCLEEYPNRIAYSLKSSQEERFDNYRIFPADNYKDIPQSSGEIWNIFPKRSDLCIQTTQSFWIQKLGQLELQTLTNQNVQVGTGTEFSLPTLELISTPTGYLGCQSQWATLNTESGTFYINQGGGKVFLFSENVEEISMRGMRNFFKAKLKSSLADDYYTVTGSTYPNIDNPANPFSGIGCISAYDERNKRFILTKKDYAFTSVMSAVFTGVFDNTRIYSVGEVFFDADTSRFEVTTSAGLNPSSTSIALSNSTYFENKSFTISYSLITQSWCSFHSYLPLFYLMTRDKFFSTNSNNIFEHNAGQICIFSETIAPFIVEIVAKADPLKTKIWENFMYISDGVTASEALVDVVDNQDLTFNKAIFYTTRQSTGELGLTVKPLNDPFASLIYTQSGALVERLERNWRINNFRDNVVQTTPEQSLWTASWSNAAYQAQYPIDKVVNTAVISTTKSQFELSRLRDKYMVIRLIRDSSDDRDHGIIIKFAESQMEVSKR